MRSGPRDLYIPADAWKIMVQMVAPKPKGMDAGFAKALEQFENYSATIGGEIGDAVRRCHDHLQRFLTSAHETISAESGDNPERLGRPREFPYGEETLIFQVFNYKDKETVSIREDRFADLLTTYFRFRETMQFMEKKVEKGNLGVLKNTFMFMHKPLEKAASEFDKALENLPLKHTTVIGEQPDPNYVHVVGTEPNDEVESKRICRILKQGFAYEGREIQEGVVVVAE